MPIGTSLKKTGRKGVVARQSARTPADLMLLAGTPLTAAAAFVGYSAWKLGGVGGLDPLVYIVAGVPAAAGLYFLGRAKKSIVQIAAIAEAVSIAGETGLSESELLVAETDTGPGKAWNELVHTKLFAASTTTGATHAPDASMRSDIAMLALESHTDAICIVNQAGRVLLSNSAANSLFGGSDQDLGNTELRDCLDEDSLAAFDDVLSGRIQRRNSTDILRQKMNKKSEEVFRFSVAPIRGSSEAFAVVVVQDVTRQRHAERSRHDFLAQATHELRTPLTNIRLYVDEAIEAGDDDPKSRAEALNVISSESLRLERIVSGLLDISELESGARSMDQGDVRIEQILEYLKSDYEALSSASGVSLTFELSPKIPVLHGDRDKIAGALHNLIGNAIKYTPSGGSVVVRAEDDETTLRITIEDTGIGISDKEQELVYEKFFRSEDSRVSDIEGTGLGLAFARQVAEMHGGELRLESELDKGSTFTITLPKPKLAA